MAYEKHDWKIKDFQKGDAIFVENLNHMEQGISEGGGSGEPAQYLKDAVKEGSKLIITKKDGSTVEFTGGEPDAFLKEAVVSGEKLTITKKDGNIVELDISGKATKTELQAEASAREAEDVLLGTYIANKVDKPNEPVEGQGVNVPYYFTVEYDEDKAVVKDYTIDLINKAKTPQVFSMDITAASSAQAGLMSKADKVKLDAVDLVHKNWYNLTINQDQVESLLGNGDQLVIKDFFTNGSYDPTNFVKDYFRVDLDNSANLVGSMCKIMQNLEKIYVDFTTPSGGTADWTKAEIYKGLQELRYNFGVDYHYYPTVVLFAGTDNPESEVIEAEGAFEAQNVVYLQDVTQQAWEYNYEDEKEASKYARGQLENQNFGSTYVLSIKGGNSADNKYILFNYDGKEGPYLDTATNIVKWKEIESSSIYKCYWHESSQRWLLTLDDNGDPIKYTEEELVALQQNGIAFSSGLYSAYLVVDITEKQKAQCCGNDNDYLIKLISINEQFSSEGLMDLDIIARPAGFIPDYIGFYDEETEEWKEENAGVYAWYFEADGVGVNIFVPKTYPEFLVIEEAGSGSSSSSIDYNYGTLYRHTFNILTYTDKLDVDDYKIASTFQAVNNQAGDSSIDYILFSDESGYYGSPDWMLPAQGKLLKCTAISGKKIEPVYEDPAKLYNVYIKNDATTMNKFAETVGSLTFDANRRYYIFSGDGTANTFYLEDYSRSSVCQQDNSVYRFSYTAEGTYVDQTIFCVINTFTHTVKGVEVSPGWYSSLEGSIIAKADGNFEFFNIEDGATGVSTVGTTTVGAQNNLLTDIISDGPFNRTYQAVGNIYRIKATYDDPETMNRTLAFDLLDDNGDITTVNVIKATNYQKYYATDFRSEISGYMY